MAVLLSISLEYGVNMKLGMQMIANINNVTQFVGMVTWGVGLVEMCIKFYYSNVRQSLVNLLSS